MNHAPDVREHDVDAGDKVAQLLDKTKPGHGSDRRSARPGGRRASAALPVTRAEIAWGAEKVADLLRHRFLSLVQGPRR